MQCYISNKYIFVCLLLMKLRLNTAREYEIYKNHSFFFFFQIQKYQCLINNKYTCETTATFIDVFIQV